MLATFKFEDEFSNADIKLLELQEDVLGALQVGDEVCFKGEGDEDLLLCTKSNTYDVKFADTSNTMLLVPPHEEGKSPVEKDVQGEYSFVVAGQVGAYLEISECAPRLEKLKRLLSMSVFKGPDEEPEEPVQKFSTEDLLERVQASPDELAEELYRIHAAELDGHWRLLDFDYSISVLESLLAASDMKAWDKNIKVEEACQILAEQDIPRGVTESVCKRFSSPSDMDTDTVNLLDTKLYRFWAEETLRASPEYSLDAFMAVWRERCGVDEDIELDMGLLEGLGLVVTVDEADRVVRLLADDLPEEPRARFRALFSHKTVWSESEITPYLRPLEGHGRTVAKLLFQYARCFGGPNGTKLYNKK